jgi:hypothetical protein
MRSGKPLIALAVLLAGLLALYYFDQKKPLTPEGTEARDKVFDVEAEKISAVRIKSSAGESSSLVKDKDTWMLKTPFAARADQSEVSGITTNLASLEVRTVVDETPKDVQQYGLTQPRIEVAFKAGAGDKERKLLIGEKTATGGDLYAKRDNEPRVFLISGYLDTTFDRKPFDLRDKSILKFDRDKVDRVEIAYDGVRIEAVKSGLDWLLTAPVKARADYSAVEGLITRLQSAQMKAVAAETPSPANLDQWQLTKPALTATVAAGSSRASLAFGKATPEGDVYARDTSQAMVVTVGKDILDDVRKEPTDFRRKDIFEFRPFNVSRLEITRGSDTHVFEKTKAADNAEKWKRTAPKAADVDSGKMDDFLSKLTALRAQSFVDPLPQGAETAVTVAARFDDGKRNERVRLDRKGDDVFAIRPEEAGAARFAASELEETLKALDALK